MTWGRMMEEEWVTKLLHAIREHSAAIKLWMEDAACAVLVFFILVVMLLKGELDGPEEE